MDYIQLLKLFMILFQHEENFLPHRYNEALLRETDLTKEENKEVKKN